jgi:hypothetical protein
VGHVQLPHSCDAIDARQIGLRFPPPLLALTERRFRFRRDVFLRGLGQITAGKHLHKINELRFALCVPRSGVSLKFQGPICELSGKGELYFPIVDRVTKPATFRELAALPPFGEEKLGCLIARIPTRHSSVGA